MYRRQLESRYKSLHLLHKIKFGISGCARKYAETQGKNVGTIATEKGWNLYVCGNGDTKPRHTELLAADLSRGTLIRYVDRFLIFYVRTADRLQCTNAWRGNLEDGLDYLKDAVINDKPGVMAELEAEIQHVINTYQDERKTTVTNPDVCKRFHHFVNGETKDTNIVFVEEHGQTRPASIERRAKTRPVHIPIVIGTA